MKQQGSHVVVGRETEPRYLYGLIIAQLVSTDVAPACPTDSSAGAVKVRSAAVTAAVLLALLTPSLAQTRPPPPPRRPTREESPAQQGGLQGRARSGRDRSTCG